MVPLAILALCLPTAFCLYEDMPYTTIVEEASGIAALIENPDYFTIVIITDSEGD